MAIVTDTPKTSPTADGVRTRSAGPGGDDGALAQQHGVGGEAARQVQVVHGDGHRVAFVGEAAAQREHVERVRDVEAGGGLVEQQVAGVGRQAACDEDALPLAAGQAGRVAIGDGRDVGARHRLGDRVAIRRPLALEAPEVGVAAHRDDLAHRERERDVRVLRHQRHGPRQPPPRHAGQRRAVERRGPFRRRPHPRQQAQQRALARPVGTDQRHQAARLDLHARLPQQPAAADRQARGVDAQAHAPTSRR